MPGSSKDNTAVTRLIDEAHQRPLEADDSLFAPPRKATLPPPFRSRGATAASAPEPLPLTRAPTATNPRLTTVPPPVAGPTFTGPTFTGPTFTGPDAASAAVRPATAHDVPTRPFDQLDADAIEDAGDGESDDAGDAGRDDVDVDVEVGDAPFVREGHPDRRAAALEPPMPPMPPMHLDEPPARPAPRWDLPLQAAIEPTQIGRMPSPRRRGGSNPKSIAWIAGAFVLGLAATALIAWPRDQAAQPAATGPAAAAGAVAAGPGAAPAAAAGRAAVAAVDPAAAAAAQVAAVDPAAAAAAQVAAIDPAAAAAAQVAAIDPAAAAQVAAVDPAAAAQVAAVDPAAAAQVAASDPAAAAAAQLTAVDPAAAVAAGAPSAVPTEAAVADEPAAAAAEPAPTAAKTTAAKTTAAKTTAAKTTAAKAVSPAARVKAAPRARTATKTVPAPRVAAATPAGATVLMIGSKPPCNILIDGRHTGLVTPQRALKVSPGAHRVTLVNRQHNIMETFSVNAVAGKPTKVIKDLTSKMRR